MTLVISFNGVYTLTVQILTVIIARSYVDAVAVDNGVVGEPVITCGVDSVSIAVNTRNPFEGKLFVKGESGKDECMGSIADNQIIQPTPSVQPRPDNCPPCPTSNPFTAPSSPTTPRYASTDFIRQTPSTYTGYTSAPPSSYASFGSSSFTSRTLNPPGVVVEFTAVISFHPFFITKVDKAYQVRCFYMEAEKTVTSEIDVSMQPTEELTNNADMPQCVYSIRSGSPNGPEVRFAQIGDKVFHRWQCTSQMPEMFGMMVHSCNVNDGRGDLVQTIDERGCSSDKYVIGDLIYERDLLTATVEAHVFKFADRPTLDFQCVISICTKEGDGCRGITPPICSSTSTGFVRAKRDKMSDMEFDRIVDFVPPELLSRARNAIDVSTPKLTVVDITDQVDEGEDMAAVAKLLKEANEETSASRRRKSNEINNKRRLLMRKSELCLSLGGYSVLLVFCTFLLTLAISVSGAIFLVRRQKQFLS